MDPLSAVGLASNILQLVEMTWKVTSAAREIYKSSSGLSTELKPSRSEAIQVRSRLEAFEEDNADDNELRKVVVPFRDQINNYVAQVDDLRNRQKSRFGDSFAAARTVFRRDGLDKMRQAVRETGGAVASHLVMI
ncbi:hypothetical protein K491DRAFT_723676 [Lophiostoma macrostomum CBS 122681]|uniref:NACHT-NTPase and P-loop NTPases N-terminal domain-containing protein n=1 Tax=Lophiostoma macrostomum CBS 122681 TaxID=1314788 RepID=A0A6A6SLB2_9PLEO|nr:hypothetical protein K491DRAFT_723676 [Lophiostoma macrostomum CBS 122681]